MKRVLLTDNIASDAVKALEAFGGIEAVAMGTPAPDDLLRLIVDFDAIVVRSPTRVTAAVIDAGARLRFIGRAGVGVDNIDLGAATRRGIVVINSPRSNTVSTAEHTLALMLAVARGIPRAHASLVSGSWERDAFRGVELAGKTLGVVGLGRVGREVASRAKAFQMRVVACDPFVTAETALALGIDLMKMPDVLAEADWLTLHVPLGMDTQGLIGEREIAAMKDGVVIVNCSRGGVVDEDALVRALDTGKVRAVALDVFAHEPPGDHAIFRHPRSVFTPHLGAATVDAQRRVATDVAESIGLALARGEIRDAVNG
ncbi:MAG TPA: hydroxyacid dehydrogenase [Candidatus Krumholzibacteria bacterium]|nr:hydroxyacid dehydrogenase [Candidatus Krumholzibacteria bacterium]